MTIEPAFPWPGTLFALSRDLLFLRKITNPLSKLIDLGKPFPILVEAFWRSQSMRRIISFEEESIIALILPALARIFSDTGTGISPLKARIKLEHRESN